MAGIGRSTTTKKARAHWVQLTCAMALVLGLTLGAQPIMRGDAAPTAGTTPWSVLLCKYTGNPAEPKSPQWIADFISNPANGENMYRFFRDMSYGQATMGGSVVRGWYQMSGMTLDQAKKNDPQDRDSTIQACVDAAAAGGYNVPAGNHILAMMNDSAVMGTDGDGRSMLDPLSFHEWGASHEMSHSYGVDESFAYNWNDKSQTWAYGDSWDTMSAFTSGYTFSNGQYDPNGPGLNAPNRYKLGWIGASKVYTFDPKVSLAANVTLAALDRQDLSAPLMIKVPIEGDPNHYYSIEYRKKRGWDRGIPRDRVLVHEVRPEGSFGQRTYLAVSNGDLLNPIQDFRDDTNNVDVDVAERPSGETTIVSLRTLQGLWYGNDVQPSTGKWRKTALTYAFANGTADIANDGERQAVRDAFTIWQQRSGLTFSERACCTADIVVHWASVDGPGKLLASAGGPENGNIVFDDDESWTLSPRSTWSQPLDLMTVAVHEVGHTIGLQHSSRGYVMADRYVGTRILPRTEDVAAVRELYPSVTYRAHVQDRGWLRTVKEGQTAGTTGAGLRAEAFQFHSLVGGMVTCEAHVQDRGWLRPVTDSQTCGTTGQGLRVEAVRLQLSGGPPGTSISYRCHLAGTGWTDWKSDGEMCGTTGEQRQMEAIEVQFDR